MDERTTRHAGYEVSQRKRKRVEQSFGWMKMIGMLRKVKLRGIDNVAWIIHDFASEKRKGALKD